MQLINSHEFAEWVAFYRLEAAEASTPDYPSDEEFAAKMNKFMALHNAGLKRS